MGRSKGAVCGCDEVFVKVGSIDGAEGYPEGQEATMSGGARLGDKGAAEKFRNHHS
jgi:hypothetical protein